jgi:hypothetical protein
MVLVIAALVLAVFLVLALVASRRSERTSSTVERASASASLPVGADAALWSIVEAVPDPRNHLALTRDLTGEVRIAGTVLDPEFRAATMIPPSRPPKVGTGSVRIIAERVMSDQGETVTPVAESDEQHFHRAS